MNELQLRTTEMFGDVQTDIYENEDHEMFMTARQLGECLGYSDPMRNINKLLERNEYLKNPKYSGVVNLSTPQGNRMVNIELRVFNERGIYEVSFKANTDKALAFRDWVGDLLIALRKGDLQLTNGNVTFSPEMFEAVLNKYLGTIDNRLIALETKKPTQPNFWLWKKQIANKAIDTLVEILDIDSRTAYDMVYDNMTSAYGFNKSFAISQFCSKYGIENTQENPAKVAVIDAVADVPEYQREFIEVINHIIGCNKEVHCAENVAQVNISDIQSCDRVQQTIMPLIRKYDDNSPNGSKTYRIVYKKMGKTNRVWKNMQTRYHCKSKKELLLKYDKYFKEFVQVINSLLAESEVKSNASVTPKS